MALHGTKIIIFGGRDNDIQRNHVPRSYHTVQVDGKMEFDTYDESILQVSCQENATLDENGDIVYRTEDDDIFDNADVNSANARPECTNLIGVGLYYNDVWSYELNCTRFADRTCVNSTWVMRHVGAWQGGCKSILGREICTVPSERWLHGAQVFNDSTMLIYGGFSQRCEDYCDDMWAFDLRNTSGGKWMQINQVGFFSDGSSPGKRWKFSTVSNGGMMMLFGGFRLWHGFSEDNSYANDWSNVDTYPEGGYLDDLWVYEKRLLDEREEIPDESYGFGAWTKLTPKSRCFASPGDTYAARGEETCTIDWPGPRAGHVMFLDLTNDIVWLHGGYTTYFPYMNTKGPGYGDGVTSGDITKGGAGFVPYGTYPFFLDDLWYYNRTDSYWTKVTPLSDLVPPARVDHSLIISGHMLFIFGGFSRNYYYDDTWLFNMKTKTWLQKNISVHPLYPEGCTDDWVEYNLFHDETMEHDDCKLMEYPSILDLAHTKDEVRDLQPWSDQEYYVPDAKHGGRWYFGIIDDDSDDKLPWQGLKSIVSPDATPMFPLAATGPNQFVRLINASGFNRTLNGTIYRRCTSVFGEPTRGRTLDGLHGRSSSSIFIATPRRKAPGWDGCRDRLDGNPNLEAKLLYSHPSQRSEHRVVYIDSLPIHWPVENISAELFHASGDRKGEIYLFGGVGYTEERQASDKVTYETEVMSDFWRMGIHECVHNCSNHGVCEYGFCVCYDGYYGLDCSNMSCPGDTCYMDPHTHEKICVHCCHDGFDHSDTDTWATGVDVRKKPCILEEGLTADDDKWETTTAMPGGLYSALNSSAPRHTGTSNGVCDGYGTCQCAPPFLGEDCSVRDCMDNCSFHGWCSVEYPVSRCMCHPGYYGDTCQYRRCLNNCSYPNGICDPVSGDCRCSYLYHPYDPTMPFLFYRPEDSNSRKQGKLPINFNRAWEGLCDQPGEPYNVDKKWNQFNCWEWVHWDGEDCSYLMAYAGAQSSRRPNGPLSLLFALVGASSLFWFSWK